MLKTGNCDLQDTETCLLNNKVRLSDESTGKEMVTECFYRIAMFNFLC